MDAIIHSSPAPRHNLPRISGRGGHRPAGPTATIPGLPGLPTDALFIPTIGQKRVRKSRAYLALPPASQLPAGIPLSLEDWCGQRAGHHSPDNDMGRRTQKPQQAAPRDSQDIGTLLQRTAGHKMAAEQDQETGPTHSVQLSQGSSTDMRAEAPSSPQAEGDDSAPATKRDIRLLLQEMKGLFDTDINLIHTETQAVTARVQASEEDILDLRQEAQTDAHIQLSPTTNNSTLQSPTPSLKQQRGVPLNHSQDPSNIDTITHNQFTLREPTAWAHSTH
ncbi:Hypothetical predicted protein [Pelobates cultripes]|uniref:Uncharacterized protein n=1 Tax=Pelobates cultripes TaxID=61616 RepID=A0AAD1RUC1_PELCU|nr:Hypothetical predicted protein [Pelobates cultripes]